MNYNEIYQYDKALMEYEQRLFNPLEQVKTEKDLQEWEDYQDHMGNLILEDLKLERE